MNMFASPNKSKEFMASTRLGGNNKGNNNLLVVTAVLAGLVVLLYFLGPNENGGIRQLLNGSAPDSSSYNPDTNSIVETPEEKKPEIEPAPIDTVKRKDEPAAEKDTAKSEPEPAKEKPVQDQAPAGSNFYSYTIKKGDTFFKIAAKFGNNPSELQELNKMEELNLQAGKEMKVRIRATYQVQPGDGINSIADKYGVSVRSIKAANGLSSETLSARSSLIIPMK
jgi:LysM repeat protein